jgi:hypothetical protein
LVLIGLGIAGIGGFSVASSGIALGSFLIGALAGTRICRGSGGHRGRALRNVTGFKAVLAMPATLIALLAGGHFSADVRTVITILLAALTERGRGRPDPRMLRRGLALAAFVAGVIAGGTLIRFVAVGAALALGLAIILAVGLASHRVSGTAAPWTAPASG